MAKMIAFRKIYGCLKHGTSKDVEVILKTINNGEYNENTRYY